MDMHGGSGGDSELLHLHMQGNMLEDDVERGREAGLANFGEWRSIPLRRFRQPAH